MQIHIEVSEHTLQKYNLADATQVEYMIRLGLQQIKIEEVLTMYRRGVISLWKAARLADMPLREMIRQAAARGYEPTVDEEMFGEELCGVDQPEGVC